MFSRRFFLKNTANIFVGAPFMNWVGEPLPFSESKYTFGDEPFWADLRAKFH